MTARTFYAKSAARGAPPDMSRGAPPDMSTYATWLFLLTTLFLVLSTGCQSTATPEQGSEDQADEMPSLPL